MRVLDMLVRILQLRLLWQTYHWRGQRRTDRYDRYYLGRFRDMQLCMDLQDSNDFVFEHVRRRLGHFSFFCQDFPGKLVLSLAQSDSQRMGLFVCKI